MYLRFIGTYTGGRTSITLCGVTFEGREPSEVVEADALARLSNHPEFEEVTKTVTPELEAVEYEDSLPETPKKRGRPRKDG